MSRRVGLVGANHPSVATREEMTAISAEGGRYALGHLYGSVRAGHSTHRSIWKKGISAKLKIGDRYKRSDVDCN